jgi:hypothetical protein
MLYAFFWVIPRRLNFVCRRFGTLFHLHRQVVVWRMNEVWKCWCIIRGSVWLEISLAIWNQEYLILIAFPRYQWLRERKSVSLYMDTARLFDMSARRNARNRRLKITAVRQFESKIDSSAIPLIWKTNPVVLGDYVHVLTPLSDDALC